MSEYTIRHLTAYEEYRAVSLVQQETWGEGLLEGLPPVLLAITHKIGGIIAGAFSPENELIGFVYGLPGRDKEKEFLWSHMLAVVPTWRGKGIGRRLKKFQKDFVLSQGIRYIKWTYDPLESVNAKLNVARLGAISTEYACDVYGDGTFSKLSRLIGTDRLIVTWFLHETEKKSYLDGFFEPQDPLTLEDVISDQLQFRTDLGHADGVLIRIPGNIQQLKTQDPEKARAWRTVTRKAFQFYFQHGYTVAGVTQNANSDGVSYILVAPTG